MSRSRSPLLYLLFLAAMALVVAACQPEPAPPNATPQQANSATPLLVFAASDLRFALSEIADTYQAERGQEVTLVFGSTGNLTQQIEHGAPADVFFAANEAFVDGLDQQGLLLEGTRQLYAIGFLVLASAPKTGVEVGSLDDLLQPEVRHVAIANPEHAPYGMAAREALETAGLWEALQPKLVLGENINQALQFVQTGNAEAGIVALSLVLAFPETRYLPIDDSLHAPLRQTAAVTNASAQPETALAFLEFVNGPSGRPVMERYGFVVPEER